MIENIGELFTEQSQSYAQRAYELALQQRNSTIEESHALLALLESPDELLNQLFSYMSLDVENLKKETVRAIKRMSKAPFWKGRKYQFYTTSTVKESLKDAVLIAKELGEEKATSVHIFWGIVNSSLKDKRNGLGQIFRHFSISAEKVLEALKETRRNLPDVHETEKEE